MFTEGDLHQKAFDHICSYQIHQSPCVYLDDALVTMN